MSQPSHTDHAKYSFKAAEGVGGRAFIMTEPFDGKLPILQPTDAFLSFELRDSSYENAKKVAAFMNEHIDLIGCTMFE